MVCRPVCDLPVVVFARQTTHQCRIRWHKGARITLRTLDPELGTLDPELGTLDPELGTLDPELANVPARREEAVLMPPRVIQRRQAPYSVLVNRCTRAHRSNPGRGTRVQRWLSTRASTTGKVVLRIREAWAMTVTTDDILALEERRCSRPEL